MLVSFIAAGKSYHASQAGAVKFVQDKLDERGRFADARARAARATSDKTSATSPGADHLTPLAFLDRPIFRIQFRRQSEFQILFCGLNSRARLFPSAICSGVKWLSAMATLFSILFKVSIVMRVNRPFDTATPPLVGV